MFTMKIAHNDRNPLSIPEIPGEIGIETIDSLRTAHHEAVSGFSFDGVESSGYQLMEDLARGELSGPAGSDSKLARPVEHILTEALLLATVDSLYNDGKFGCPVFHISYDGDSANTRLSADLKFRAEFEEQVLIAHVRYVPKRPLDGGVGIMEICRELNDVADFKLVVANRNAASPAFAPDRSLTETFSLVNLQTGDVRHYV
jgi:hypothetical protein